MGRRRGLRLSVEGLTPAERSTGEQRLARAIAAEAIRDAVSADPDVRAGARAFLLAETEDDRIVRDHWFATALLAPPDVDRLRAGLDFIGVHETPRGGRALVEAWGAWRGIATPGGGRGGAV
jgi:hypothetical protein